MKTLIKILLSLIILIFTGYYLFYPDENGINYDPQISNTFIRTGVIKKIYANYPDSSILFRDLIFAEEGITEEKLNEYKEYLKSNPEYFAEFLDSVDARIDSLLSLPRMELKRRILPAGFIPGKDPR